MLKSTIIFLILIATGSEVIAQNRIAYYDALYFYSNYIQKGKKIKIEVSNRDVFEYYFNYIGDNDTVLDSKILADPFFDASVYLNIRGGAQARVGVPSAAILPSSVAGLDVTKYVNAIADIMIDRAKQELTIAFFNRFKRLSDEHAEFRVLFPKTTDNLTNLLTFSYPQMLPALRSGFLEDVAHIDVHLDDVLELPAYKNLFKDFPEARIAVRSIRLVHDLQAGKTIADVLKEFSEFEEWQKLGSDDFKNMGSTIQFAAIFSESLRYKDNTRIWVQSEDIVDLVKNEAFTKIFMGLVYQQILKANDNKSIKFKFKKDGEKDLAIDIIGKQVGNILIFQNKIAEFIGLADKVKDSYNDINDKQHNKQNVSNDDIYNYVNVSIAAADYAFSVLKIFQEDLAGDKYIAIVKKSNALYKDVYTEQYTQAVNDAIDILTSVHDLTKESKNNGVGNEGAKEKATALDKLDKFIVKVKPYALFMANMVEAKDEDAVKAALENAILPVGSSGIKKYAKFNISVQSYLGAAWTFKATGDSVKRAWSDKFCVTAPIGFSFNKGLNWGKTNLGSAGIFVSLLDIGAIVDYKLKTDTVSGTGGTKTVTTSKDYKIELGQIFSPGVYFVYGFAGNLPLTLGIGAQYGPGLHEINNDGVITDNPAIRYNLFLAVDLPFFTLYNRKR